MATLETSPKQETEKKPKFTLTVKWQRANGEWTESTSERSYDIPDDISEIKVSVVSDDGKTADDVTRNFQRRVIHNVKEGLDLLQNEPYLGVSALNYALDLFARGTIKGPIAAEVEGPGKTIQRIAKQLFDSRQKLGKPLTMERALEIANAMQSAE